MSSIDNRIVQMQFQNSEFEKGVNESIKSLDKLKKSLEFKETGKSLDSLRHLGDSFNLTKMSGDIEAISERFSALGIIGRRVLENLTDGIYNATTAFVKDLSFNNINAGFDKYIDKTKSVQAIMNATGMSIEGVDKQLTKLQWFTDETSYNFVDMVSNIGKFTAMGVDLETSVTAMQGIANWAAVSGQGVQEASRAMYNLAQAMGIGAVKMTDWKSITLANMGTKEFKETVIDTAKALGVLNKTTSKTKKGTLVNLQNFESTLSEGWFNSDVLLATLKKYGEYADAVYDVQKAYEETNHSSITAAQAMKMVSDETMKLGSKAFKAAQEYTNFNDTIVAVKDAVSSGWMKTFELIFGNYREGIEVWTALGDTLYEVFASGVQARNEILEKWKEIGGRTELISGLTDSLDGLLTIIDAVKTGFRDVFPQKTAEQVKEITDKIANFGHELSELYHTYEKFTGEYKEEDVFGDNYKSNKAYEELKRGSRGESVKDLQKRLHMLGYGDIVGVADGIFGPKTEAALKKFQEDTGLTIDGIYDDASHKNILGAMFEKGMALDSEKIGRTAIGKKFIPQYETVFSEQAEELRQASKNMFTAIKSAFTSTGKNEEIISKANREAIIKTVTTFTALAVVVMKNSSIWQNLGKILHGVVSIFSIGLKVFGLFARVILRVVRLLMPLIETIFYLGGVVGDAISAFDAWISKSGVLDDAFKSIANFLEPLRGLFIDVKHTILDFFGIEPKSGIEEAMDWYGRPLKKGVQKTLELLGGGKEKISKFYELWTKLKENFKNSKALERLKDTFASFKETLDTTVKSLKEQWTTVKETLGTKFTDFINGLPDKISNITDTLATLLSDGLNLVGKWVTKVPSIVTKLKSFWDALFGTKTLKGGGKKPGIFVKVKQSFQSLIDYLFGSNKVGEPKKVGMVSRILRVASGDMVGAREGMSDQEFESFINKVNKIKEFFKQFGLAIKFLFSGDVIGASELNTGIFVKISRFRSTVVKIFDAIRLLFTGNVREGTSLSQDSQDKIKKIRDTIKNVFLGFINAIKFIFTGSFTSFEGLSADSVQKLAKFRASFMKFFDAIGLLFTGSARDGTNLSKESQDKILTFRNTVIKIFGVIKEAFVNIWNTIKGIFSGDIKFDSVTDLLKQVWDGIKNFFTKIGVIISETGSSAWEKITDFFSKVWKYIKKLAIILLIAVGVFKIGKFLSNLGGLISSLKDKLDKTNKNRSTLAKSLFLFGASIALIAGSIWLLATLKPEEFKQGISALTGIIKALAGFIIVSALISGTGIDKGIQSMARSLMEIAISVGILALSVILLKGFSFGDILSGIFKLILLMVPLALFMKVLSKMNSINVNLKGFWQIAIVLGVMAVIVYLLGNLKFGTLVKGVLALAGIMIALSVLMRTMGKFNATNIDIKGFIGLSVVIGVMAIVIRLLGRLDIPTLGKGIGALLVIMGLLIGFIAVVGKVGKSDIKIKGLLGLAIVIGVIGYVMNLIGNMTGKNYKKAMGAITLIMVLIGGIIAVMGTLGKNINPVTSIIVFLGLAAIIYIFGEVMEKIKKIDPKVLYAFSISLAIALLALVGSLLVIGKIPGGTGAMLKGAAGLGGALDILIILLGGLMVGIGELDKNGRLSDDIERGGEILKSIGGALAGFKDALGISGTDIFDLYACMEIVGLIPGGALAMLAGAGAIGGAFDILVILLGGLVAGLGELDSYSDGKLSEDLTTGGDILTKIADALVSFKNALGISGQYILDLYMCMEIIGLIPGGALAMLAGAGAIAGAFDVMVALIGGLLYGLGAINDASGGKLEEYIASGTESLSAIGSAIGAFAGSIKTSFQAKESELQNEEMLGFSEAFTAFSEAVSGLASDENFDADVDVALKNAQALHDFFSGLEGYDIIIPEGFDFHEYATAASQLSTDMGLFGQGAKAFADNVKGYSTDYPNLEADKDRAVDIAIAIHGFFSSLESYKVEGNSLTGIYTAPGQLSVDMAKFGAAIASLSFWLKVANLNEGIENDTTIAIGIASAIKTFFDEVDDNTPDGLGLINYQATISSYLGNVAKFGWTIAGYNAAISGIAKTTINEDNTTAIQNARAIATFLNDLGAEYTYIETNKGTLDKWLNGDTVAGTVLDSIGTLGEKIGSAAGNIAGIGAEGSTFTSDIEAAKNALISISGLFVVLSDKNLVIPDHINGYDPDAVLPKFDNLLFYMEQFLGDLGRVSEEANEYDFTQLSNFSNILANLSTVLSGKGENAITTDNFLGGLDAGDVIQKLSEFTNAVGNSIGGNIQILEGSTETFNTAGADLANATMSGLSTADTSGAAVLASNMQKRVLGYRQKFVDAGGDFAKGLAKGVEFNKAVAILAAEMVAKEMLEKVKGIFEINSPSKVTESYGNSFIEGLSLGIYEDSKFAVASASDVATSMLEAAKGPLAILSSIISEGIDDSPVITPVVDLTNARLAAGSLSTMFGNQSFGISSRYMAGRAITSTSGTPTTQNQNDSNGVIGAINDMNDRIGELGEAISNMQMVVDSGALVGQVANKMDERLGVIAMRKGRMG